MIKNLILDLDGVLTDGRQYIAADGKKMFKAFHSRDIRAIREFIAAGVRVIVLSADDWPGGAVWCERTGAEFFLARDKADWLKSQNIDLSETVAVGDDAWDLPMLRAVKLGGGKSFCPSDAADRVLNNYSNLKTIGGHGVVAELLELLEV